MTTASNSKHVYGPDAIGQVSHSDRVYIQNVAQISGAINAIAPLTSGQVNVIFNQYLPKGVLGELKVAESTHIVYATFAYAIEPRIVVNSGVGTHTESVVSGMAKLTTGADGADRSVLRTRLPLRYIPSQGIEANMTAIFSSGTGAQLQLVGALTDAEGFAFGMSGSIGGIYRRSFGATEFIEQANWNQHTLRGSHDWSKGNAYRIETQSHGFSLVRCSIEDPLTGHMVPVHEFYHGNNRTTPDVRSPATKLRAEIDNNGEDAACTLYVVAMDGRTQGSEGKVLPGGASGTGPTAGSGTHILTLRNKRLYFGEENQRTIVLKHMVVAVDGGADAFVDCFLNLAVSGTSFADVDTQNSICDLSNAGQLPPALSGALDGTIAMRNVSLFHTFEDIELAPEDTLTLVCRKFGGSNGVNVNCYLTWKEHQ